MKSPTEPPSFSLKVLEKALEFHAANENFDWFSRPEVRADMDAEMHRKALQSAFERQREARNDLTKSLRSAKIRIRDTTVQECIAHARAQAEEESADEIQAPPAKTLIAKTLMVRVELYPEEAFVIARELDEAQKEVTRLTSREVRNSLSSDSHRIQLENARAMEASAQVALVRALAKANLSPSGQTMRDCLEQATRLSGLTAE